MHTFDAVMLGVQGNRKMTAGASDGPQLRSFVVEDQQVNSSDRHLRRRSEEGECSLYYTRIPRFWFDIFALLETSCYLCVSDDDYYNYRSLEVSSNGDSAQLRQFETALCDALRSGPYDSFQDLSDCQVIYYDA